MRRIAASESMRLIGRSNRERTGIRLITDRGDHGV